MQCTLIKRKTTQKECGIFPHIYQFPTPLLVSMPILVFCSSLSFRHSNLSDRDEEVGGGEREADSRFVWSDEVLLQSALKHGHVGFAGPMGPDLPDRFPDVPDIDNFETALNFHRHVSHILSVTVW